MSLSKTVYTAERANVESDGKHIRLLKRVEGPHAELRDDMPSHVARLSEEQARRLRADLDEVLDD